MAKLRTTTRRRCLGTHIIAELFGCDAEKLNNASFISDVFTRSAELCGAHVLHAKFHAFSPQGITGYFLLSESHFSIHTWPEHTYAAVDLFTCGVMNPDVAIEHMVKEFGASRVRKKELKRGRIGTPFFLNPLFGEHSGERFLDSAFRFITHHLSRIPIPQVGSRIARHIS